MVSKFSKGHVVEGRLNDTMMLQLLEGITACNRDKRRQLRVAYNSIYRRVFGYRNYESVRALQSFLGGPNWEELVKRRSRTFLEHVRNDTILNIFI